MNTYFKLKVVLRSVIFAVLFSVSVVHSQKIEIEDMQIKTSGYEENGSWVLNSEGYVADTIDVESSGFYRFKIRARGHCTSPDKWPKMEIHIGTNVCGPIFVDEDNFLEYKTLAHIEPGKYLLSIWIINPMQDEALILDWINIYRVDFTENDWLIGLANSIMNKFPEPSKYSPTDWQINELMWGVAKAYEKTHNFQYLNYIRTYLENHVDAEGTVDFQIADVFPGSLLAWLFQSTGEIKYLRAAKSIGEFLLNEYPRTSEGGFAPNQNLSHQLWVETLGSMGRFLGIMGKMTGNQKYFEEGTFQFKLFASHLQNQGKGLFYQAWDENRTALWSDPNTGCSSIFWAKGNGWAMRGLSDLLSFLPSDAPQRDDLISIVTNQISSVIGYQDTQAGLWHTVLDSVEDVSNYFESTATILFAYSIQKCINIGILPSAYQLYVDRTNKGLFQKIYDKGNNGLLITGISAETAPGDYENYINVPVVTSINQINATGILAEEKAEILANFDEELEMSSVNFEGITDTSAIIFWRTNMSANSQVEYGHDTNYGYVTQINDDYVNIHVVQLSELDENSTYHFHAISRSRNGQIVVSEDMNFNTLEIQSLSFSKISVAAGVGTPSGNVVLGGHGTAFADIDGDGLTDLYISFLYDKPIADMLFRNIGESKFLEEAGFRGVSDFDGGTHGICFADFDNDGDYDLINGSTLSVNGTPAKNNIYRNDGNGYFQDVTNTTDIIKYSWPTRSVLAFDMENDGDLDIFAVSGFAGSQDPKDEFNEIYRNDGNFHFISIDTSALRSIPAGQGAVAVDYDNDGDIDVFAANRTGPLNILQNDGNGNFSIVDPNIIGIHHLGREGITFGDIDQDGDLDMLLVGDETGYYGYLYRNNGDGTFNFERAFEDIDGYMGGFADLDNDCDLDLVFAGDDVCYLNNGSGFFEAGPAIPIGDIRDPRSISYADIDNDGDLDFAVGCKRSSSLLIRNNLRSGNWLKVKLVTDEGQAGAFGARVYIYPVGEKGNHQIGMREATSSQGYLGQNEPIIHFGLAEHSSIDIVVKFLDGKIVERESVMANQLILVQGDRADSETISTPATPVTSDNVIANKEFSAETDSSFSSEGHAIEYIFDWGDGSFSSWGGKSEKHVYGQLGFYEIRARARCQIHPEIMSDWSLPATVAVRGLKCEVIVQPEGSGFVEKRPEKNEYAFGDTIMLFAIADSGYEFVRWEGDIRCDQDSAVIVLLKNTSIVALFSKDNEHISPPAIPSGPDTCILGKAALFYTHHGSINKNIKLEYQFKWEEGDISAWGDSTKIHTYNTSGEFSVRARVRCKNDTTLVSDWSDTKAVLVRGLNILVQIIPDNAGTVRIEPSKNIYAYEDSVDIIAHANRSYRFWHWNSLGDTSILRHIKIMSDMFIKAYFDKKTNIENNDNRIPKTLDLGQNYPNPFNMETVIKVQLPRRTYLKLMIYNINGQKIATLAEGWREAGEYFFGWGGLTDFGKFVPSGVYFYIMDIGREKLEHKMVLLR